MTRRRPGFRSSAKTRLAAELGGKARGDPPEEVSFLGLVHAYLEWLVHIRDGKPSTQRATGTRTGAELPDSASGAARF